MEVDGAPLGLLDARSAAEAKTLLALHPDIAMILLDVVMETEFAGLSLVTHIRKELSNRMVQIVLVTGQPGHAQELEVRNEFEIDGYRLKSELSAYNIYASVNLALNAYKKLRDMREEADVPSVSVEMQLAQAIEAHRQWREKLKAAVAAAETLDPHLLRRTDCCELGNWLHTRGRQMYGTKPEFVKLMTSHNDFHYSASMAAHAVNERECANTEKLIDGHSQFAQTSIELEVAIMKLQFALSY
jgi:CheY-like chemotaxis protein